MISIKTEKEIELMTHAGKVAYDLLNALEEIIKPGISTKELDIFAEKYIKENNCTSAEKGYEGYPASICTSVNEEVVHGIPSDRVLKNGDIISIDIVVCYKGYNADTARTYEVGTVKKETKELMINTKQALYKGLSVVKEGIKLNEVCKAIESVALSHGYGIIRELTGHGIGANMHEDPYIPNYSNKESEDIILKCGMTLAIEPMFSLKNRQVWLLEDDWTIVTRDKSPAAHFEHTIVVTKDGYKILTGE